MLKLWRKFKQIITKPNKRTLEATVKMKRKKVIPSKLSNVIFSILEMTQ